MDRVKAHGQFQSVSGVKLVLSVAVLLLSNASNAAVIETDIPADTSSMRALYSEQDITAFIFKREGRVFLTVPFPEDPAPFTLTLFGMDGEQLLLATYQLMDGVAVQMPSGTDYDQDAESMTSESSAKQEAEPIASDSAYKVEFSRSGQFDATGLSNSEDGSDFEERDTDEQGETDLLGSFRVEAGFPRLIASAEVEAVHRSNPDNTVRYQGSKADLSQFRTSLEYEPFNGSTLLLHAGDVDVTSANSLVNTGMSSRGFSLGFISPDDRFRLEVGRLYGQDVVGMVRGPLGFSTESYRIGANAALRIIDNDEVNLGVHFSLLDVKRDIEDAFALGASQSGEKNTVRGFGSDLSLFDQRVNLSLNWAHSDYDNPAELNEENIPAEEEGVIVFTPGATTGKAYRHSLQWNLWESEDLERSVALEYSTEKAEPFYRSVNGIATADRREWSIFSDLRFGVFSGRLGTTQYQNNLDNLISIHTLDEAVHTAELGVELQRAAAMQRFGFLKPSYLAVRATVEEMKTLNGDNIILAPVIDGFDFMNQTTETVGLSLSWEDDTRSTSLDIDYIFLDNSQRERANADSRDLAWSVSHSFFKDNWNIDARLGFSVSDDLDSVSRSTNDIVEWGLSGSYTAESGVMVSAGVDRSTDSFLDRVLDEKEDNRSYVYSVTVDVGNWLFNRISLPAEPSLTASWHRNRYDSRSIYYTSDQVSDAITINVGVPF